MNRINERDVHPFTPRVIVGMTLAFDVAFLGVTLLNDLVLTPNKGQAT